MAQHTPGPWLYGARPYGMSSADICTVFGVPTLPTEDGKGQHWAYVSADKPCYEVSKAEQEANGKLIAAAPDLLSALREATDIIADRCKSPAGTLERFLRAIAKAEGR